MVQVLLRGVRIGVGEVFADGAGEEDRVLEDDGGTAPEGIGGDVPDVHAVNQNLPGIDVVEAHEQVHHRGLPGAGGPHQGHLLSGPDLQVKAVEDLTALVVGEVHVPEGDGALGGIHGALTALVLAGLVQDGVDPLRAGDGGLDLGVEIGQLVDRAGELLGVYDEGGDDAHGDHAVDGEVPAEGGDDDEGDVAHAVHDGPHGPADGVGEGAGEAQPVAGLLELPDRRGLPVVGGDGAVGRHLLLHQAVELA